MRKHFFIFHVAIEISFTCFSDTFGTCDEFYHPRRQIELTCQNRQNDQENIFAIIYSSFK